ncbi:permease [Halobacillus fulvus]|nr:permease [Halobacillus fulvus]
MDYTPKAFSVIGVLFCGLAAFLIYAGIQSDSFPVSMVLTYVTFAVLSFCMRVLYPQIKQKDERMKWIRQKATLISFVGVMLYLIVFQFLYQFGFIQMDVDMTLSIIVSLSLMTLFLSMVVLAKRY